MVYTATDKETPKKDPTEPGYEEYKTLVADTRRNIKGLKLQLAITTGILEHAECMLKSAKPPKETPKTPDTADTDHKSARGQNITHADRTAS